MVSKGKDKCEAGLPACLGLSKSLVKELVLHNSYENATAVRCDRNSKGSALWFENLWVDGCVAH